MVWQIRAVPAHAVQPSYEMGHGLTKAPVEISSTSRCGRMAREEGLRRPLSALGKPYGRRRITVPAWRGGSVCSWATRQLAKTVLYAMSIICALCILLVSNLFGIGFVALLGLVCFCCAPTQPGTSQMASFFWQFNSAPASSRELTICSPNTRTLRRTAFG